MFSTGLGTLYAVSPDGILHWFRHTGFLTGSSEWLPHSEVGTGWTVNDRILSVGDGLIYGVYPNGSMLCHWHVGWQDGSPTWRRCVRVRQARVRSFRPVSSSRSMYRPRVSVQGRRSS